MNPSVRVVCGGCLRSVELSADGEGTAASLMSSLRRSDRQPFEPVRESTPTGA